MTAPVPCTLAGTLAAGPACGASALAGSAAHAGSALAPLEQSGDLGKALQTDPAGMIMLVRVDRRTSFLVPPLSTIMVIPH